MGGRLLGGEGTNARSARGRCGRQKRRASADHAAAADAFGERSVLGPIVFAHDWRPSSASNSDRLNMRPFIGAFASGRWSGGSVNWTPFVGTMEGRIEGVISPAHVLQDLSGFCLCCGICGQRVCVVQAKRHIHSPRRRLDLLHAGASCSATGAWMFIAWRGRRKLQKVVQEPTPALAPRRRWRRLSDAPHHT